MSRFFQILGPGLGLGGKSGYEPSGVEPGALVSRLRLEQTNGKRHSRYLSHLKIAESTVIGLSIDIPSLPDYNLVKSHMKEDRR